jgi:hypothetical protein
MSDITPEATDAKALWNAELATLNAEWDAWSALDADKQRRAP